MNFNTLQVKQAGSFTTATSRQPARSRDTRSRSTNVGRDIGRIGKAKTETAAAVASDTTCPFIRLSEPLPRPGRMQIATENAVRLVMGFRAAVAYRQDPLKFQSQTLAGRPISNQNLLGFPVAMVGTGTLARAVLGNEEDFPAGSRRTTFVVGSEAMLGQTGIKHATIRGLMAPFFMADEIEKYTARVQALVVKYLDIMVECSNGVCDTSRGPRARQLLELFTLEVICNVVAGLSITDAELQDLKGDLKTMVSGLFVPITINLPFMPYGQGIRARQRVISRIELWLEAARQRLAASKPPAGVLDELVGYQGEQGQRLTQQQLVDNMCLFLFAGYDTTAATITAMIYYLNSHPHVVKQLAEEQEQVIAKHGPQITSQSLQALKAADRCVRETLRLKPVVPGITRQVQHDMRAEDVSLRRGEHVHVAFSYISANDPQWAEKQGDLAPELFNPDRWLEGKSHTVGQQMPFGYGRHTCLGMALALMEVKTMLAELLRNYEIVGVSEPTAWQSTPILEPNNGLPVLLRHKTRA